MKWTAVLAVSLLLGLMAPAVLPAQGDEPSLPRPLQVDTIFADDFESGSGNWAGDWGLTMEYFHSDSFSFTDSPDTTSPDTANLFSCMVSGVDLSEYMEATLILWNLHWLEQGADSGYLEISIDAGTTWTVVKSYNDTLDVWTPDTINLGAFLGDTVLIGFRVVTDSSYTEQGWFVDDIIVIGSRVDTLPPIIVHTPPADTESIADELAVVADINDISGVATDSLYYRFDGGAYTEVTHDSASGDTFYFTIPQSSAGTFVDYYLVATDSSAFQNRAETEVFSYVAGTIVYNDDGQEDYVYGYAAEWQVAVRLTHGASICTVTTGLYKFHGDSLSPVDSVWVKLWNDDAGTPGGEIISPFKVWPSNTPEEPRAWTKVDLRAYNVVVSAADFHVGCEFVSGYPYLCGDYPAGFPPTTYLNTGMGWNPSFNDAYIRAVVALGPPGVEEVQEARSQMQEARLYQNQPNPFTHATTIRFSVLRGRGAEEQGRDLSTYERINLSIYDLTGRLVKTLVDGGQSVTSYESPVAVRWDGTDEVGERVASGVYFYRLQAGRFSSTKRMVLLR